jgi:hypothetical protein
MKKVLISAILTICCMAAFSQTPLYRYYNHKLQKHYYTIDFNEYGKGGSDWTLEGVACQVFRRDSLQPDRVFIYRFFNPQTGDHYYTVANVIISRDSQGYSGGYQIEGPVFCAYKQRAPGTLALLEYYNPVNHDHFYTVDKTELGRGFEGYVFDNIAGFVLPK